jgi:hypothetical protein
MSCINKYISVRLQVLTAASKKMASVVGYCAVQCPVEVDSAYSVHNQIPDNAVRTSDTSVNFYETTRRSIPEDCLSS